MSEARSIEVKVGALILIALVLLGGFVLLLGGLSLEKTYRLYVDFDNPGGLLAGAAVRIGGVKVGSVKDLEFLGGKVDPKTGRRIVVRTEISVEKRVQESIHQDADFYVTAQGVLGEQFLAINPGSPDKPQLEEGAEVKGIDPPRLDLFLAKAYELLDTTVEGIKNNRVTLGDIIDNTDGILKGLNLIVSGNRERIERTLANVEDISVEAKQLTHDARTNYVDNPKVL
ncbi:MAG TPA: MlaD family protein, partial [Polyangiaceae bacterium]|nr:MlaD family protein [Polyangiaceae bacterium]